MQSKYAPASGTAPKDTYGTVDTIGEGFVRFAAPARLCKVCFERCNSATKRKRNEREKKMLITHNGDHDDDDDEVVSLMRYKTDRHEC